MNEDVLRARLIGAASAMSVSATMPDVLIRAARRRRLRTAALTMLAVTALTTSAVGVAGMVRDSASHPPAASTCRPFIGPFELYPPGRPLPVSTTERLPDGRQVFRGTTISYPVDTVGPPGRTIFDAFEIVSPDEAWAVGAIGDARTRTRAMSWHFIDGRWSQVEIGGGTELVSVDSGGGETWASGHDGIHSFIVYYSDGAWHRVAAPSDVGTVVAVDDRGRAWITPGATNLYVSEGSGWREVRLPKHLTRVFKVTPDGPRVWVRGDNLDAAGRLSRGESTFASLVALDERNQWRVFETHVSPSDLDADGRGGAWVVGSEADHTQEGLQDLGIKGYIAYINGTTMTELPVKTSMYISLGEVRADGPEVFIQGEVAPRHPTSNPAVNPGGFSRLVIRGGCR